MSKLTDAFKQHNDSIQELPPLRYVKTDGGLCEFVSPGFNIIATHNMKEGFTNIVLAEAKIAKLENVDTINGKLIHFDVADEVDTTDIKSVMHPLNCIIKYPYERYICTSIQDIYAIIKKNITMNSTIVITSWEKITFDEYDIDQEFFSTARAKLITQVLKMLLPILANNNSMLIIGHYSEEYENITKEWRPDKINHKRITDKPVPEIPFATMLYFASSINKIIQINDDRFESECIKNIAKK